MGTNYYLKAKRFNELDNINKKLEDKLETIKEDYLSEVLKVINNALKTYPNYKELFDLDELIVNIEVHYPIEVPDIHVCKMSLGWVPIFEKNEFYNNYKEFKAFYEKNKDILSLVDEYDREISLLDFETNLEYFKLNASPLNSRQEDNYIFKIESDDIGYDWSYNEFT